MLIEQLGPLIQIPTRTLLDLGLSKKKRKTHQPSMPSFHRTSTTPHLEFGFLFLKFLDVDAGCPVRNTYITFISRFTSIPYAHRKQPAIQHSLSLVDALEVNTFPETDRVRYRADLAQIDDLVQFHQLRTSTVPGTRGQLFRKQVSESGH